MSAEPPERPRGPRLSDELRPYVNAGERDEIDRFAEQLTERPLPRAAFRAELHSHLHELVANRRQAWRPQRLRTLVFAYIGSGLALLAVAAVGLGGTGPLGY